MAVKKIKKKIGSASKPKVKKKIKIKKKSSATPKKPKKKILVKKKTSKPVPARTAIKRLMEKDREDGRKRSYGLNLSKDWPTDESLFKKLTKKERVSVSKELLCGNFVGAALITSRLTECPITNSILAVFPLASSLVGKLPEKKTVTLRRVLKMKGYRA